MSKMSEISLTLGEAVKDMLLYLIAILLVLCLILYRYIVSSSEEERITNLETQLQNQMNCIDSIVSDVDNLKEVKNYE